MRDVSENDAGGDGLFTDGGESRVEGSVEGDGGSEDADFLLRFEGRLSIHLGKGRGAGGGDGETDSSSVGSRPWMQYLHSGGSERQIPWLLSVHSGGLTGTYFIKIYQPAFVAKIDVPRMEGNSNHTRQKTQATHPQCHQHHPKLTLSSPRLTISPHVQHSERP